MDKLRYRICQLDGMPIWRIEEYRYRHWWSREMLWVPRKRWDCGYGDPCRVPDEYNDWHEAEMRLERLQHQADERNARRANDWHPVEAE